LLCCVALWDFRAAQRSYLVILLALYLALFFLFQRLGMDIVRQETGSPIAARSSVLYFWLVSAW